MIIKIHMRSMQITTTGMEFGPEQRTVDFKAILDKYGLVDLDRCDEMMRTGRPLFLASENELGGTDEITALKEQIKTLTAERDQAVSLSSSLKAVAKNLLEHL
jgi:hypothetical protein